MSEENKLVRMANQIAAFFHTQPALDGPQEVADHINKFWEPRMRRALFDLVENEGGEGLDGLVRQAVPLIRRPPAEAAHGPTTAPPAAG